MTRPPVGRDVDAASVGQHIPAFDDTPEDELWVPGDGAPGSSGNASESSAESGVPWGYPAALIPVGSQIGDWPMAMPAYDAGAKVDAPSFAVVRVGGGELGPRWRGGWLGRVSSWLLRWSGRCWRIWLMTRWWWSSRPGWGGYVSPSGESGAGRVWVARAEVEVWQVLPAAADLVRPLVALRAVGRGLARSGTEVVERLEGLAQRFDGAGGVVRSVWLRTEAESRSLLWETAARRFSGRPGVVGFSRTAGVGGCLWGIGW